MFELSQGNVEGAKKWSTDGILNLFEISNEVNVADLEPENMYRYETYYYLRFLDH